MTLEAFLQVAEKMILKGRLVSVIQEAARAGEPLFLWDGKATVFLCVWKRGELPKAPSSGVSI